MALWGVSGSDVTNYGRNTAVGLGVFLGSAITAYVVRNVAAMGLSFSSSSSSSTSSTVTDTSSTVTKTEKVVKLNLGNQGAKSPLAQYAGAALGIGAAAVAYIFIPGSRFALITDDSTIKMFKLGVVQTIFGLVLDGSGVSKEYPNAAIVGLGGALATRFGNLPLAGLGIVGALVGSGLIKR